MLAAIAAVGKERFVERIQSLAVFCQTSTLMRRPTRMATGMLRRPSDSHGARGQRSQSRFQLARRDTAALTVWLSKIRGSSVLHFWNVLHLYLSRYLLVVWSEPRSFRALLSELPAAQRPRHLPPPQRARVPHGRPGSVPPGPPATHATSAGQTGLPPKARIRNKSYRTPNHPKEA